MKKTNRKEEDFIVGYTDKNPKGQLIYHPLILNQALIWATVVGVVLGVLSYLVAYGTLPVADLGQFSASADWVAGITGFGVGIAIGGLAGGFVGLYKIMRM
jgi:small-conductance mechanosensitive channel